MRFFYGVTQGQSTIVNRFPFRPRAAQASHRAGCGGSGEFSGSCFQPEGARGADDGLCCGSAVPQVAALKISDIDSRRMVLRIERGKGGKERYAMLSETLLGILPRVLAAGAAEAVPVSRSAGRHAD